MGARGETESLNRMLLEQFIQDEALKRRDQKGQDELKRDHCEVEPTELGDQWDVRD